MPTPRKKLKLQAGSISKSPPAKRHKACVLIESDEENQSDTEIIEKADDYVDSDGDNDSFELDNQQAGPSNRVLLRNELETGPSSPIRLHATGNSKKDLKEALQGCIFDSSPYQTTKHELEGWIRHLPSEFKKLVIFSFGQYAREMAEAALFAVQNYIHISQFVILVPPTVRNYLPSIETSKIRTLFYNGIKEPLSGLVSCTQGSKAILETIIESDSLKTMFLFLGSHEGEELFCWPDNRVDLEKKKSTMNVIRKAGATQEQLRICRARLSGIRGDKLANFIQQGSAQTLLISNAYPGPIRYEQCGVLEMRASHISQYTIPDIMRRLRLNESNIDSDAFELLNLGPGERDLFNYHNDRFTTRMIGSNDTALRVLSKYLTDRGYDAHIVNKPITGCAMANGRLFAKLITRKIAEDNFLISGEKFDYRFPVALIFGGKLKTTKEEWRNHGGPNLNLVRHCMDFLSVDGDSPRYEFTFMSATTTGSDHGANVAGALISNDDIVKKAKRRTPYVFDATTFWKTFNNGANLLDLDMAEKKQADFLDVQVLLLHRDLNPAMVPELRRTSHAATPHRIRSPKVMNGTSRPNSRVSVDHTPPMRTPSRITSPIPINPGIQRRRSTPRTPNPMSQDSRCGNCGKAEDVKFRKVDDSLLCNACYLYYKKNGRHRPDFLIRARSRAESIPKSIKSPTTSKW